MKPDPTDRWKIRRKLIVGGVFFGAVMIVAGSIGLFQDRFTGEMIYGGVTIITTLLGAYAGMATWDDKNNMNGGTPDG